ncbi:hypothetical protein ACFPM0_25455 [Pseudonocardia sulfidoxydans]|uniref:hypothetical protein n=1 Tax=Pseudonocardia sulfidoxydans TaxID=54011 RepID=UPI00361DA802
MARLAHGRLVAKAEKSSSAGGRAHPARARPAPATEAGRGRHGGPQGSRSWVVKCALPLRPVPERGRATALQGN